MLKLTKYETRLYANILNFRGLQQAGEYLQQTLAFRGGRTVIKFKKYTLDVMTGAFLIGTLSYRLTPIETKIIEYALVSLENKQRAWLKDVAKHTYITAYSVINLYPYMTYLRRKIDGFSTKSLNNKGRFIVLP